MKPPDLTRCQAMGIKEPPSTGTCSEADNYGAEPGYQSHLAQCPCCKNFVMREVVEAYKTSLANAEK